MVTIEPTLSGMHIECYITHTFLNDVETSRVVYGTFATAEQAQAWAKNLQGDTVILPVYSPAFNRG
jgi:hypothetical protein